MTKNRLYLTYNVQYNGPYDKQLLYNRNETISIGADLVMSNGIIMWMTYKLLEIVYVQLSDYLLDKTKRYFYIPY
ncbi:hypothetical protein [Ureibacillus acetophenoni]